MMRRPDHRAERWLFASIVLLTIILVSRGPSTLAGTAPQILAMSHSILYDGDLDLRNQYDPNSTYVFATELDDLVQPAPALALAWAGPLLVADTIASSLPEWLLERVRWDRVRATRDLLSVMMALLTAWLAVLTLRLGRRLGFEGPAIWLIVAVAFVTPPLVYAALLVGATIPAALLLIWFAHAGRQHPPTPWAAIPLALVPWVDSSYGMLPVVGLLWLGLQARTMAPRAWVAPVLRASAILAASGALLAVTRWWLLAELRPGGEPEAVGRGLAGLLPLLVNPDVGLLVVAPFWILAIVGIGRLHRLHPSFATLAIGMSLGVWWSALRGDMGPQQPPGVWLVPALPLLLPSIMASRDILRGAAWPRWAAGAVAAWSLAMTVSIIERPTRIWPGTDESLSRSYSWVVDGLRPSVRARKELASAGIEANAGALRDAARAGNIGVVRLLLRSGVDGTEALVAAASDRRSEVLRLLLERGAADGTDGARALAWAMYQQCAECITLLRAAGASMAATNPRGETIILIASLRGRRREFPILVNAGANVNAASHTGTTALMASADRRDPNAAAALLRLDADPDIRDRDGMTALHRAALTGQTTVAAALLAAGAAVDPLSHLGWTPLMRAAHEGHDALVAELLAAGADPNVVTTGGQTALVRAIQRGHIETVRALLAAGADPLMRVNGSTAREWAGFGGDDALIDTVEEAGTP